MGGPMAHFLLDNKLTSPGVHSNVVQDVIYHINTASGAFFNLMI